MNVEFVFPIEDRNNELFKLKINKRFWLNYRTKKLRSLSDSKKIKNSFPRPSTSLKGKLKTTISVSSRIYKSEALNQEKRQ